MLHIHGSRRPLPFLLAVVACGTLAACDGPGPTALEADLTPSFSSVGGSSAVDIVSATDGSTVMGAASLTRSRKGITMRAHMTADHGETFTVWAVVFNNPDACASSPCEEADLGNPDTGGNAMHIAGGIAGGDGLHVAGRLKEGDLSEALIPGAPALMDAMTAEIHFVYRSHGPKLPTKIRDQIMTFDGGCDMNPCVDVAFSVHLP
jgi:hypothetical protein